MSSQDDQFIMIRKEETLPITVPWRGGADLDAFSFNHFLGKKNVQGSITVTLYSTDDWTNHD